MNDVLDEYGDIHGEPFMRALALRGRRLLMKAEKTYYTREDMERIIAELDGPTVYEQLVEEWKDKNASSEEAGTEDSTDSGSRKGAGKEVKGSRAGSSIDQGSGRGRSGGKGKARPRDVGSQGSGRRGKRTASR